MCVLLQFFLSDFSLNIKPNILLIPKQFMYAKNLKKTFNAINLFYFLHIRNYIQFYEWACSQNYICPVNLNMQKYLH